MGDGNDILRGLSWCFALLDPPRLRFSLLVDWQVKYGTNKETESAPRRDHQDSNRTIAKRMAEAWIGAAPNWPTRR